MMAWDWEYSHILLVVLVFVFANSTSCSSLDLKSISAEREYNRWISWNLKNHRKKMEVMYHSSMSAGGNVVDGKLRKAEMNRINVTVSEEGDGDFSSISEAIAGIPKYNSRRVVVMIKPGIYRENIHIPRTMWFVTFRGDSTDPPTITGNDTASVIGKDRMPLNTFQSATVGVEGNYFMGINIKLENTASHKVGTRGEQGVAVRISGTKAAFYNCSFLGSQDTLYDHKGLHYFNNCFIQGSVDFIFGYGRSLYENCKLNSIAKKVASMTGQKRSNSSMGSGFSFKDCRVTGSGPVYLGRAWGDYSRVVFSFTFTDAIVVPQGWSDWGDQKRDNRVFYGEYKCFRPGADMTGRVPWARILTDEKAEPFVGTYYVDAAHTWLTNYPLN